MALSFTEKRGLQKSLSDNTAKLRSGSLGFKEKRALQSENAGILAQLRGTAAPTAADSLDLVSRFYTAMQTMKQFIGQSQLSAISSAAKGEEKDHFMQKMIDMADLVQNMPQTYGQDGQGEKAIAFLHYFRGGSDWYITEKDAGSADDAKEGISGQVQAFGYAILNGDKEMAEMGTISIAELIGAGVELDLYYSKQTIGEIKGKSDETAKPDTDTAGDSDLRAMRNAVVDHGGEVFEAHSGFVSFTLHAGEGGQALLSYSEGDGYRVAYGEDGRTFTKYYPVPYDAVDEFSKAMAFPNSDFTDNYMKEMVDAIVGIGGEVTGKQDPSVFFLIYGGVSAKVSAVISSGTGKNAGFIAKNIDSEQESSIMQTAEQALSWLMTSLKDGDVNLKLIDLQSGKYNDLEPQAFLGILYEVSKEIGDFEPLKAPTIAYIEKNLDKVNGIMESALQEAFGKFWNITTGA